VSLQLGPAVTILVSMRRRTRRKLVYALLWLAGVVAIVLAIAYRSDVLPFIAMLRKLLGPLAN